MALTKDVCTISKSLDVPSLVLALITALRQDCSISGMSSQWDLEYSCKALWLTKYTSEILKYAHRSLPAWQCQGMLSSYLRVQQLFVSGMQACKKFVASSCLCVPLRFCCYSWKTCESTPRGALA